ncbi:GDP-mannose 4,6-dehydratase [Candidatus Wolfebacteria bacterium]|nr:GDP-mannose 4,6-dehydratase [Candidatus Wolfebacteria bacterium]
MEKHNLQGKNILITGATGLVGGHLAEKLVEMGANAHITYRSFNPKSYFAGKKLNEKVISAVCDIKDFNRVFDIITKYEIEYIFHVAAQPIVSAAYINPRETLDINIMGTVNILEAARRSPMIKGIVVASSDKAYGKKCNNATEIEPMAGDHPYDVSKSCADLIARAYTKTYDLPVAVSRFGNIYGPGDFNFNRIVPGVMKAILKNETLKIRSNGKFVRDYVYVKDVIDGYIVLMENMSKIKGEAFNFSTGYNFSVIEMIKKIEKILNKKCKYKILNIQKNEIPFQSLNFEKAEKVLGWNSKNTLEEGIVETFNWYKELLS